MMTKEERSRALLDKIEDYEQTVKAILAFAAIVVHDGNRQSPNSNFGIGRRMTTSSNNSIAPNTDITPDLVAQHSNNYGIVAEFKKSLSKDPEQWHDIITQIRKYNDSLEGWWIDNDQIQTSDTAILIHYTRSRKFIRFLKEQIESNPDLLTQNSCVIEFQRSDERMTYFTFRKEWGEIHNEKLNNSLRDAVPVPLENVVKTFGNLEFYDCRPPMPKLLQRLWQDVFPSRISEAEYDEELKAYKIDIGVDEVTEELQSGYGSKALSVSGVPDDRDVEFPRTSWIRNALDWLVANDLAIKSSTEDDYYYTIHFKAFRKSKDILEKFIEMHIDYIEEQEKDESQIDL
ncbi:MAG TPA: hypothetical protein VE912_07080, partial [Bacteroidales bacterium]|nr:hypothetical protein [Bacteroidales bacterium]